jgi:hypothetical protein
VKANVIAIRVVSVFMPLVSFFVCGDLSYFTFDAILPLFVCTLQPQKDAGQTASAMVNRIRLRHSNEKE